MSNFKFWLSASVLVALVFVGISWYVSTQQIQQRIDQAGARLELLGDLRRHALEDYFATAKAELRFWSTDPLLVSSQEKLVAAARERMARYRTIGEGLRRLYVTENPFPDNLSRLTEVTGEDAGLYTRWHTGFHPLARLFVDERGYYDFFMITPEGFVLYTVEKESDFATSLADGPWSGSPLARVYKQAMDNANKGIDKVSISDMAFYEPSAGAPAVFMAKAIHGDEGELLGVVALQLPMSRIQSIMKVSAGMGRTGETYLVGEDLLMRSDSRFIDESTTLKQYVETDTAKLALAGETGVQFTDDYRGVEVLSAYTQTDIDGNRWGLLAEMDREEILEQASGERRWLGAMMLFFYALSLWTVWYLRGPEETLQPELALPDMPDITDGG